MSTTIPRLILAVRLNDGTEHPAVLVTLADRMKLAAHSQTAGWGTLQTDPDRSLAYLAWHALRRTDQYAGTFSAFVLDTETVTAPEDVQGTDDADPTRTATP